MSFEIRLAVIALCAALLLGQEAPPTLPTALARLQANDAAGAAAMLEQITAREPRNGRAWRNLGVAYQALKKLDLAAAAYRHSLDVEPEMAMPLYQLGAIYAAQHDREHAMEWLRKAKASRKVDVSQAAVDPDFAWLRNDAAFRELLPKPADFQNPFVEPVRIIREWRGEGANDQFGWIARNIGDVDGDGVPDVVTSAPTKGDKAGRVYVYSTRSGKLLWTADGEAGDQFGNGVEAAGDTNQDGIPDVVVGAPGGGYANILSGRDGRVLQTFRSDDKGEQFGLHVSGVGDVNHDGFDDVIVGAPGHGGTGAAYVYSGKDGRVLMAWTGERAGDRFGAAVAGYSDAHRMFLVVGAPAAGEQRYGRAYVYDALATKPKFTIESDETGAALGGMFLSVPGDVDGDGVPDIYASDWQNRAKGPSTGRIYVHSGKDGHRLLTLTGETVGEGFGTSPSVAGDVDGDGHADLIVGAWQYSGGAPGAGRAYLHSGKDGRLIRTFTCKIPGEAFGFDAASMGDIDGSRAFLITSAWSGVSGFHSGRVFIVSSGVGTAKKGEGSRGPGAEETRRKPKQAD